MGWQLPADTLPSVLYFLYIFQMDLGVSEGLNTQEHKPILLQTRRDENSSDVRLESCLEGLGAGARAGIKGHVVAGGAGNHHEPGRVLRLSLGIVRSSSLSSPGVSIDLHAVLSAWQMCCRFGMFAA